MSFDCSRFSFHPWKDFFGVVMQQGRVQLDSDWNEGVVELARRLQAGTMDTVGRAVVPRITPNGFRVLATAGELTIGPGRMYVDGLLAENHGAPPLQWDTALAELGGTADLSFVEQPYLPFYAANQPAPADVFNRPALTGGPHLVFLDVWPREVTHLQEPGLVEKAVGVDTTARLQTVWQVKLLANIGSATCATPDGEVPGWAAVIRPSGARLTNFTGEVPGDPNPCLVPPAAGYKGLENQLYRVEIHRGGPQGTATFNWSRDNATVATRVTEIQGGNRLVVESIGRDEVLGFHAGEWIEVLDDWHELHGRPGLLRRIRPGDGVDAATRSILLEDPLLAGLFPVDAQGRTDVTRHTRIRRWDQSGIVRRADGSTFHDLDASASSDGIPVPAAGTRLALENGILVEFALEAGSEFKVGDYWVFAARVADGSIEPLDHAPPRGIHHHYARLAVVTLPDSETDCRVLWPPEAGVEGCDCTVCVSAEAHNAGTATLQHAIDSIKANGGTACLGPGVFRLRETLRIDDASSVRVRGQGWRTILIAETPGALLSVEGGIGVTIESLSLIGSASGGGTTGVVQVRNTVCGRFDRVAILGVGTGDAVSAAVVLSGYVLGATVRDCAIVAGRGIVNGGTRERNYLLTASLAVEDNLFSCRDRGVSLERSVIHYGLTRCVGNLVLGGSQGGIVVTGGVLPGSTLDIAGNELQVSGDGIRIGTDGARIRDNEINRLAEGTGDGIALVAGLDPTGIDHCLIFGNRILRLAGDGIALRTRVNSAMIKHNVIDGVGGGAIVMEAGGSAGYLSIENNQLLNLGVGFNVQGQSYSALRLVAVERGDVSNNLLLGVARDAVQASGRFGIQAAAIGDLAVSSNRLHAIGPVGQFVGGAAAIMLIPPFVRASVTGNAASRAAAEDESLAPAGWQGLAVVPPLREPVTLAPNLTLVPFGERNALLTATHFRMVPARRGTLMIRGNSFDGALSSAPLVEVAGVESCLLTDNSCRQTSSAAAGAGVPLVEIRSATINASNNRLEGARDLDTMRIFSGHIAVVGNLANGAITVGGQPLQAPWAALNDVTAP